MIGRLIGGALLGAVAMMITGFVFWGILADVFGVLQAVPNDEVVAQVLAENIPASGVYLYPFPASNAEASSAAFIEKHVKGPLVQITFTQQGVNPMAPAVFLGGIAHFFVSALLLGGLLLMVMPGLPTYGRRVTFIFLAGLFAAVAINLISPIWWHHPWGYHVFSFMFNVTGWLLAGLLMAWLIRPATGKVS